MTILLIYASNSGSTYTSGLIIKEILSTSHQVEMKKTIQADPDELQKFDLIILGSPSWDFNGLEGMPHQTMIEFIQKMTDKTLPKKKFAVFGCGDSSYTYFCGAVDHLEKFVESLKGERIVNSLRVDGFYFDLDNNTEKVKKWAEGLNEKLGGANLKKVSATNSSVVETVHEPSLRNAVDDKQSELLIRLQKLSNIPH